MFAFDGVAGSIVAASENAPPVPGAGGSQKLLVAPFGKYIDMYRRAGDDAAAAVWVGASASSQGRPRAMAPPFSMARRGMELCERLIRLTLNLRLCGSETSR